MGEHFLPKRGNYRGLIVYQKAECIYDITYYFTSTYLKKGDRTIDQMVESVRSEKLQQDFLQNGGIKEQMYRARISNRK